MLKNSENPVIGQKNPMTRCSKKTPVVACLVLLLGSIATFAAENAYAQDTPPAPAAENSSDAGQTDANKDNNGNDGNAEANADGSGTVSSDAQNPAPPKTVTQDPDPAALKAASQAAPATATVQSLDVEVLENPLKEEVAEYWSSEGRDLKSLEDRVYTKDGRFEVALYVGIAPSSPFWWYLPLGLRLTYNFNNYYGLEFSGGYSLGFAKELQGVIEANVPGFDPERDLEEKDVFRTDLNFVWRPLYGKFGFFNKKIAHFDVNFVIGLGLNGTLRPDDIFRKKVEMGFEPELVLGTGTSFFLAQDWTMRIDFRGFLTRGAETKTHQTYGERLHFPVEFSLGFSYLF